MNTIPVEVVGDIWHNPQYVQQELDKIPAGQHVVLDFRAEGPSMYALGICDMLDRWLDKRSQTPDFITIACWSNATESIPYSKIACSIPSHFWKFSKSYWYDPAPVINGKLFALFVGRSTIARNTMLYQVAHQWPDYFVLSKMKSSQPDPWTRPHCGPDAVEDWMIEDVPAMVNWHQQCPIASVDHKELKDQFGDPDNHGRVNRSLLNHYNTFEIELVCETYTLGTTFFPTEKTVRPIMAAKPILVYGPVNFLQELRNMGFKTYSDVWDEDYDQQVGVARWQSIKKIIAQVIAMNADQKQQLLTHAKSIAEFNRQHLQKSIPW